MPVSDQSTIKFSNEESQKANSTSREIELDDAKHLAQYGAEKTEFTKLESVYLKVSPTYSYDTYDILVSSGTCVRESQNNAEQVEELVDFAYVSSGDLSNIPDGAVTCTWVAGGDNESPTVVEGHLTLSKKVVGILKCNYQKRFDRLRLVCDQSMEADQIIVLVGKNNDYSSIKVDYQGNTVVRRTVTLAIKDVANGSAITNARVIVGHESVNVYSGVSNSAGVITVENLIVGRTYSLKVTASNYIDSDKDYINNDFFTVPSA